MRTITCSPEQGPSAPEPGLLRAATGPAEIKLSVDHPSPGQPPYKQYRLPRSLEFPLPRYSHRSRADPHHFPQSFLCSHPLTAREIIPLLLSPNFLPLLPPQKFPPAESRPPDGNFPVALPTLPQQGSHLTERSSASSLFLLNPTSRLRESPFSDSLVPVPPFDGDIAVELKEASEYRPNCITPGPFFAPHDVAVNPFRSTTSLCSFAPSPDQTLIVSLSHSTVE
jgi:hypothetical protein